MKKITILTIVAFVALTSSVFAQDRKNVVKINLFSIAASTANIAYERALNEKTSFQLDLAYTGASASSVKYSGYQIQPEVRFYLSPNKNAPAGFYVAPFARYRSLGISTSDTYTTYDPNTGFANGTATDTEKATWNQIGGGVVLGGQWLVGNERVAIGLFGGPAYYSNSFKYKGTASAANFSLKGSGGFSLRTGVTLGVAF